MYDNHDEGVEELGRRPSDLDPAIGIGRWVVGGLIIWLAMGVIACLVFYR